jgi:hypothetical protein
MLQLAELLLTLVSVVLLAILLYVWMREHARTKARFTLGLVLFAGVFLLKESLHVLEVLGRAEGVPLVGTRIGFIVALGEVVALAMLVYVVAR